MVQVIRHLVLDIGNGGVVWLPLPVKVCMLFQFPPFVVLITEGSSSCVLFSAAGGDFIGSGASCAGLGVSWLQAKSKLTSRRVSPLEDKIE